MSEVPARGYSVRECPSSAECRRSGVAALGLWGKCSCRKKKDARHLVKHWRLKPLNDSALVQPLCLCFRRAEGGKDGSASFEARQLAPFDGSTCPLERVPSMDPASPHFAW